MGRLFTAPAWLFVAAFKLAPTALAPERAAAAAPSNQAADTPVTLSARIEASPVLPFTEVHLAIQPPSAGWELGPVSGVASGRQGHLYLIQRGNRADPLIEIDVSGRVLRSWGAADFELAHSVRVDPGGDVWAVDAEASRLIRYTSRGEKLQVISVRPVPDTKSRFRGATDVAFGKDGQLFVADGYGNARVAVYSTRGRLERTWGEAGAETGQFNLPHAIQLGRDGRVYVADRENSRIQVFDSKGRLLAVFPHLGRCTSLKLVGSVLWVSVSPSEQSPGAPGWLLKLSSRDGRLLGHIDVPDHFQGHEIDVLPSGEPVLTAGSGVLWFKRLRS